MRWATGWRSAPCARAISNRCRPRLPSRLRHLLPGRRPDVVPRRRGAARAAAVGISRWRRRCRARRRYRRPELRQPLGQHRRAGAGRGRSRAVEAGRRAAAPRRDHRRVRALAVPARRPLHLSAEREPSAALSGIRLLAAQPDSGDGEAGRGRGRGGAGGPRCSAPHDRAALIAQCRALADGGVRRARSRRARSRWSRELGLGEVVLLTEGGAVAGFAICHTGAGSEGGRKSCYIKFALVRSGDDAAERLRAPRRRLRAFRRVARRRADQRRRRHRAPRRLPRPGSGWASAPSLPGSRCTGPSPRPMTGRTCSCSTIGAEGDACVLAHLPPPSSARPRRSETRPIHVAVDLGLLSVVERSVEFLCGGRDFADAGKRRFKPLLGRRELCRNVHRIVAGTNA